MKTILKSHGLWDLVIKGFDSTDMKKSDEFDTKKKEKEVSSGSGKDMVAEVLIKDAKALGLIQGAVSDEIFPRISHEETSKSAWNILQQEFHEDKQSFELRLDRHSENKTEKAFASLSVEAKSVKTGDQFSKQNKSWKSKGKKWERKTNDGAKNPCKHCGKLHFGECRFKGKPKCFNCDKLGHIAKDCYSKKPTQQVHYANQVDATPTMFYASNATNASIKGGDEVWYLDSGCSNHMTGREDLLVDINKNVTTKVEMGTGQLVEVTGKGSLVVETKMGKKYIKEVMLVPGLKENLLSVGHMIEHGYYLVFGDHKVEIYNDSSYSNLIARIQMRGNRSFPMKLQAEMHLAYKANVCHSTAMWHRRLGYLNMSSLKLLQEQEMVVGLPEIIAVTEVCEACILRKQCRESFPKEASTRASTSLELVHSDICGPMQTTTKAGNRYFLTFIDDSTRMCWVYFLRQKSETLSVFRRFKATVELQSDYKLKKLRSDRGGEYNLVEFDRFCADIGIERPLTTPYTPQQNGVAERKNRTIVEMAKCLLLEKKIPLELWAETVNTSVYILNRCLTKALNKKTPFEAYSGRKPGVKHMKVFGSLCYAHVLSQQRQKLDLTSKRCIFLGYRSCEKGYRLYSLETGKIIVSRDVVFNENASWDWDTQKERSVMIPIAEPTSSKQGQEGSRINSEVQGEEGETFDTSVESSDQERMPSSQDFDHTPRKYKSITEIYEKCNMCIIEPESFEEAAKDESWKKAMEDEILMINKNNTWELVNRPFDKPIIGVK
ncbi:unnamed protein product [Prunus armeniaca]